MLEVAADLATTRARARSEPPITVAAPDSRASAKMTIRTAYIRLMNGGCGTIGGIAFRARPIAGFFCCDQRPHRRVL